jgi:conjugative transposon TraN protein
MKKSFFLFFALLAIGFLGNAYGQATQRIFFPASKIKPYHLEVGYNKTTVLIFPAAISKDGIDRGSAGIIAKAVPGVENILKVKANTKDFPQTNLTVITKDGKVYSFRVNYSDNPPDAPVDMSKQKQEEKQIAVFRNRKLNNSQIQQLCKEAASGKSFLHKSTKTFKVKLKLQCIYTCKDVIFYRFQLKNKSNIDYTLDFSRFYIRDRKRVKRTAQQEKELHPLSFYYANDLSIVPGNTSQTLVVAFRKFTIADNKNFVIQLFEKHGDRNPVLKIKGSELVKAQSLTLPQ